MKPFHTRWFSLGLAALLALMGALGATQAAQAIEFDDDGIIAADEVLDDDVFISGETVLVDGTVNGILFASGDDITINGTVNGDLFVNGTEVEINGIVNGNVGFIGRELSVNGTVEGSLYSLGASLTLEPSAAVGRNVVLAGFGIETKSGSTIGRDLVINSARALLAGRVDQDVDAEVDGLELAGSVGGDVTAKVSKPEPGAPFPLPWSGTLTKGDSGLRVAEEAQIGGTLTYTSPVEQADAIRAVPGGGVVYQPPGEPDSRADLRQRVRLGFLARVRELITLLVLGALAAWKTPLLLSRLADRARAKPLPAAGWGLVMIAGGFTGAVVLAGLILILGILLGVVTLGGLTLAVFGVGFPGLTLALALFWLAGAYGSKLVVAYLAGKLILRRAMPQFVDKAIWPLALGVALYTMLRSIPLLGWLIGVVVTLVGLGAMWLLFRERRSIPTLDQPSS